MCKIGGQEPPQYINVSMTTATKGVISTLFCKMCNELINVYLERWKIIAVYAKNHNALDCDVIKLFNLKVTKTVEESSMKKLIFMMHLKLF